jgi:hypothetical protein
MIKIEEGKKYKFMCSRFGCDVTILGANRQVFMKFLSKDSNCLLDYPENIDLREIMNIFEKYYIVCDVRKIFDTTPINQKIVVVDYDNIKLYNYSGELIG